MNVSAVPALTGVQGSPAEGGKAPKTPPSGEGVQFLSTLLAALGMAERPSTTVEPEGERVPASDATDVVSGDETASGEAAGDTGLPPGLARSEARSGDGLGGGLAAQPSGAEAVGLAMSELARAEPAGLAVSQSARAEAMRGATIDPATGPGLHVAMGHNTLGVAGLDLALRTPHGVGRPNGTTGDGHGAGAAVASLDGVIGAEAVQSDGASVEEPAERDASADAADPIEGGALAATGSPVPPTVPPRPVDDPDPTLDNVDPDFREKVERVIERMREEFGHDVTVVEGYRSPERQAHLYEQGRTRPGPIATWTRDSWHSEGLAADLMVDGSYGDRRAYARLQRVAREEGLRTLGSRDLGHVELPRELTVEPPADPPLLAGRRFVGVARPAAPAAVAAVAPVAVPGQWVSDGPELEGGARREPRGEWSRGTRETAPADSVVSELTLEGPSRTESPRRPLARESALASAAPAPVAGPAAGGRGGSSESDGDADVEAVSGTDVASARHPTAREGADTRFGAAPANAAATQSTRRAAPVVPVGSMAFDRLDRVEEAKELARTVRPARISVRLDGAGSDQLRVGLLNRAVDAQLDLTDAATADRVRARVDQLHRALEARGLGLDDLSVNGLSTRAAREGWLSARPQGGADVLETLFASASGSPGGESRGRERSASQENMNRHGGASSNRQRRERQSEE